MAAMTRGGGSGDLSYGVIGVHLMARTWPEGVGCWMRARGGFICAREDARLERSPTARLAAIPAGRQGTSGEAMCCRGR